MPTEFWLQKKAFNSWSHVTWYNSEAECRTNLDRVAVEGNGYSWRMVRVEVVEERLLHDESPVLPPEPDLPMYNFKSGPVIKNSGWSATPAAAGWGKPAIKAAPVTEVIKSEHGSVGLIWLGNPVTKEKRRVSLPEAMKLQNEGWVRAGPRTVL